MAKSLFYLFLCAQVFLLRYALIDIVSKKVPIFAIKMFLGRYKYVSTWKREGGFM